MRTVAAVILLVLLASAVVTYRATAAPSSPGLAAATPPIGSTCCVQFRRDALGCAASLPVPPTSNNFNGANVSVEGKLLRIDSDWLVLAREHNQLWIPRQNVLLVQVDKQ